MVTGSMISLAGLERMVRAYSSHSSFSDSESEKSTAALMDEVNICRAQFGRFNDEGAIWGTPVFWPI